MNDALSPRHILRYVLLLLAQVLILKNIQLGSGWLSYIQFYAYPLFLLLLPLGMSRLALLFVAFGVGLSVDLFYWSWGTHTAASVLLAYARHYVLGLLEPRGGYSQGKSPTRHDQGLNWYLQYSGALLFLHLLWLHTLQVFSFAHLGEILLRTFLSFIMGMLLLVLDTFLFNPKA